MPKNSVHAIPMTSIDSSTFIGTYKAINATGLPNECFFIRIINDSNVDVFISYDGTNAHDYLQAGDSINFNIQANARPKDWVAQMEKGTIVYVNGAAGAGYVFLVGYYQEF